MRTGKNLTLTGGLSIDIAVPMQTENVYATEMSGDTEYWHNLITMADNTVYRFEVTYHNIVGYVNGMACDAFGGK